MSSRGADPTLVRKRHLARVERLKRRLAAFSILGFAAFFGLAAQHVVRGSSSSTRQLDRSSQRTAVSAPATYFDQSSSDFSFGDSSSALPSDLGSAPQPMAQTSVS